MAEQTTTSYLGVAQTGVVLLGRSPSGTYYELNLEGMNAGFIPGEWLWTEDKLDSRTALAQVTMSDVAGEGGNVDDTVSDDIDIESGEVWVISDFTITGTAAQAVGVMKYNVLVSSLPSTNGSKAWFTTDRTCPDARTEIFHIDEGFMEYACDIVGVEYAWAADDGAYSETPTCKTVTPGWCKEYLGELGCDLRIVGPATITLKCTATTAFAAAEEQTCSLNCHGRKVNKVVV